MSQKKRLQATPMEKNQKTTTSLYVALKSDQKLLKKFEMKSFNGLESQHLVESRGINCYLK